MMSASNFPRLAVVCAGLGLLAASCELQKTVNQTTATDLVVATMLATPPFDVRFDTLAQFDASVPDSGIDGGGVVIVTDAGITLPSQSLVSLFFGKRVGTGIEAAPRPNTGAQVRLSERGGGSWPMTETGSGNYLLEPDAGFVYLSNATYDFVINSAGNTYTANIENAPPLERIAAFHPPTNYIDLAAGQDFSFDRPAPPAGQERNLAFVNVFPVDENGNQLALSYSNIPQKPTDFLKLVVAPTDWKQTTVRIPGSAFPNPGSWYLILLQSAKLGRPQSDNLFLGSAVIAGTAEIAVVRTRD